MEDINDEIDFCGYPGCTDDLYENPDDDWDDDNSSNSDPTYLFVAHGLF